MPMTCHKAFCSGCNPLLQTVPGQRYPIYCMALGPSAWPWVLLRAVIRGDRGCLGPDLQARINHASDFPLISASSPYLLLKGLGVNPPQSRQTQQLCKQAKCFLAERTRDIFASSCWVTSNIHMLSAPEQFRAPRPISAPVAGLGAWGGLVGVE